MIRRIAPKLTLILLFLTVGSIRLTAQASCSISNTFQVFFQTYSSATIQTTGSIQFTCTSGTAYTIGLNAGSTAGATIINRMMLNPHDATLGYQLFSDASYTTNWGNSAATNWYAGVGTGGQQTVPVYAQIPGGEAFFAGGNGGNYNDMVTVTITWGSGQTTTRTLQVTLQQVSPGCGIGASPLNFGNYTGALLQATTTLQVACTSGTTFNVGLDIGTGSGATITTREMTGPGGAELGYQLFRNAGDTLNWGNTVGTDTLSGAGNNGIQNLTVYGKIPAGQSPPSGTYTDTIIAILTY